jgi:hypothetical protein
MCCRKILKAPPVTTPDVFFRNIVAARQNPISDAREVDLDIFCPDVYQYDLKAAMSDVEHHLEIVLARECGLYGEAFGSSDVLSCGA